jgi:hypothetical protein
MLFLLIRVVDSCSRVCLFVRARALCACAHISVSVFVYSPFPARDFLETSLISHQILHFILTQKVFDPRVKESTLALSHTHTERERERERKKTSLVYNLRGRAYLVFSSFCLFLGKRVCVQITVER